MTRVTQTWNADGMADRVREALAAQNRDNAYDLAGNASEQAPVEFGDLRGSLVPYGDGNLFAERNNGLQLSVGSNLPYAAVQHERLDFNHPIGGKAKYLEDPLNENKGIYLQKLADAAERAMKT